MTSGSVSPPMTSARLKMLARASLELRDPRATREIGAYLKDLLNKIEQRHPYTAQDPRTRKQGHYLYSVGLKAIWESRKPSVENATAYVRGALEKAAVSIGRAVAREQVVMIQSASAVQVSTQVANPGSDSWVMDRLIVDEFSDMISAMMAKDDRPRALMFLILKQAYLLGESFSVAARELGVDKRWQASAERMLERDRKISSSQVSRLLARCLGEDSRTHGAKKREGKA